MISDCNHLGCAGKACKIRPRMRRIFRVSVRNGDPAYVLASAFVEATEKAVALFGIFVESVTQTDGYLIEDEKR